MIASGPDPRFPRCSEVRRPLEWGRGREADFRRRFVLSERLSAPVAAGSVRRLTAAVVAALITLIATGPIAYLVGLQQNRRKRFEDRRDEVIAELSGRMFRVQDAYVHWFTLALGPVEKPQEEVTEDHAKKGHIAVERQNDLILYFYSNEAWLDPETAARVEDFIAVVREITYARDPNFRSLRFYLSPEGQALSRRAKDEISRARVVANSRFKAVLYPPWYNTPLKILEFIETRLRRTNRPVAGNADSQRGELR